LVIGRNYCGIQNHKLKEIIHEDFFALNQFANQLEGIEACYFCLGISSVGMTESTYKKLTYELTLGFANNLYQYSPQAIFCYVSAVTTDFKGFSKKYKGFKNK
jgi:hypothetical protein